MLPESNSTNCTTAWAEINNYTSGLNWYDLYRKVYPASSSLLQSENRVGVTYIEGERRTYLRGMTQHEYTPWLKNLSKDSPVLGNGVSDYLNREDVRKALHIPASV